MIGRRPIVSGYVIEVALAFVAFVLLAPLVYVSLRPVFAPPRIEAAKITLRAGPLGAGR